jgi:hypothetical protein
VPFDEIMLLPQGFPEPALVTAEQLALNSDAGPDVNASSPPESEPV